MQVYDVSRVMRECRNFFESGYHKAEFTIAGGSISPAMLFRPGSYIAIDGSCFHNGVYRVLEGGALEGVSAGVFDETFTGKVWFLCPPSGFLALCEQVAEFVAKTPKGGYQSETFGDYSYNRAGGKDGGVLTWQQHFSKELAEYRHMFTEVNA